MLTHVVSQFPHCSYTTDHQTTMQVNRDNQSKKNWRCSVVVFNKINGPASDMWSIRHWVLLLIVGRPLVLVPTWEAPMCNQQKERGILPGKPVSSPTVLPPGFEIYCCCMNDEYLYVCRQINGRLENSRSLPKDSAMNEISVVDKPVPSWCDNNLSICFNIHEGNM